MPSTSTRGWPRGGEGLRHDAPGPGRYLPELKSTNPNARSMAERIAMNAVVQGSAADLIKIAMVQMAVALESLAREIMEGAMALAVPLRVDIKTGLTWADV